MALRKILLGWGWVSYKYIRFRLTQKREKEMKRALTRVNGRLCYVDSKKALTQGTCYFCGGALAEHPRDKNGRVPINRHHRVGGYLQPIYTLMAGNKYPAMEKNLFWAGLGCHVDFHRKHDYPLEGKDIRRLKRVRRHILINPDYRSPKMETERLQDFFRRFLKHMQGCNFGEGCLEQPRANATLSIR